MIDLEANSRSLSVLDTRKLGETVDWPFYQKIHLLEDESHVLTLSTTKINKVRVSDRSSMVLTHGVTSSQEDGKGTFWYMQVVESSKKVYVAKEFSGKHVASSTQIYEMNLDDLKTLRKIAPNHDFGRAASFLYSARNHQMYTKDLLGAVMRVYDTRNELNVFENETVLDVCETSNLSFALLDYPEMNIFFQGGIEGVFVVDYAMKKVIAKFRVKGQCFSLAFSKNKDYLLVGSRVMTDNDSTNYFHRISLKTVNH